MESPYSKTFKKRNSDKFIKNQIVAVKKSASHKEDQKFGETVKILENEENDTYRVKIGTKVVKNNHKDIKLLPQGIKSK